MKVLIVPLSVCCVPRAVANMISNCYCCYYFCGSHDEDMPVDSLKQHAVVVYIDSGDCTEALLRSELADIEAFDGES